LREREILMAKTPHLVWPIRLVLPHVPGLRPRWLIRLGLLLYDHLAPRRRLAASAAIDFRADPAGAALKPELRHGFAYSDCRGDDARLVIANLLGSQQHGAHILARHRFVAARRDGDLWTIGLENAISGERFALRARALVNAAGPWLLAAGASIDGIALDRRLRLVKGSHIVVPRQWDGDHGYFLQTRDGRTMEAFPFEGDFTSIGTTDEPWDEAPERVRIAEREIDYMLAEVNRYLRKPVQRADILWSYAGVRPLFEVGGARDSDLSTLTRDYSFDIDGRDGRAPVLTIFGGKLTTHRRLAEDALSKLTPFLRPPRASSSARETLPGGDLGPSGPAGFASALSREFPWLPESQARRYARLYGTRARALLGTARTLADLGAHFGADLYQREVAFLIETEWARTADDILWRRTKLGLRLIPVEVERLQAYLDAQERDAASATNVS